MIIDSHSHILMPDSMYRFLADLVSSRGNPNVPYKGAAVDDLQKCANELVQVMNQVGTDAQFVSPRPYMALHSVPPATVTEKWTRAVNDAIHRQCQMFPKRIFGVAGLPQFRKDSPADSIAELERCVKELGFIGCLLNPDPTEGAELPPPGLGDRFWYPLYEKLCELDVPALIHSASCCDPRESYTLKFINEESIAIISLLESNVFKDFPTLKIVISHGGGAIPYHMGRFRAWNRRRNETETFDSKLRKLYYDTCNYSKEALEFQFRILGVDNCMFGTERPGTGTVHDPDTNADFDNLKPIIEKMAFLTDADRKKIFETNALKVYSKAFK